jgi:translation initiation factor IF-3
LKPEKKQHRLNNEITAEKVRLINAEGEMIGLVSLSEAIEESQNSNLDLVEMNNKEDEPVCKVMDYGKFLYQQKKNKKNKQVKHREEKEIKFRPVTESADLVTKTNKIKSMLKDGHSVKLNVVFKNREVANMKDLGKNILKTVMSDLEDICKIKKAPHLAGKNIIAIIEPNNT